MPIIIWIILATFVNGLMALAGAVTFLFSQKVLKKITFILIAFSAGTLLGGGLLHLLPEALDMLDAAAVFLTAIIGFSLFFLVEKFLHWHHCHDEKENCPHPFTYLILFGDGIHNLLDGLAIAAAFLIDIRLGIITTLVIISHELPQ